MTMDHNFWLGVAGIGYTAGTLILGRMIGVGKKIQKLENVEKAVDGLSNQVSEVNRSLINCQTGSALNRGSLSTEVSNLGSQVKKLQEKTDNHAGDRDVHTDREWREGTIERVEKIAGSIGTRISSLESNICQQLDGIRLQMKNGTNGNGSKLS